MKVRQMKKQLKRQGLYLFQTNIKGKLYFCIIDDEHLLVCLCKRRDCLSFCKKYGYL